MLVGVWQSNVGAVRLDGFELSHWNPHELGQHIGYLPQDVELFEGTVAENIARFGMIDKDEILSAAQLAGCHELIQNLPKATTPTLATGDRSFRAANASASRSHGACTASQA